MHRQCAAIVLLIGLTMGSYDLLCFKLIKKITFEPIAI
jgi:hypothetical protein